MKISSKNLPNFEEWMTRSNYWQKVLELFWYCTLNCVSIPNMAKMDLYCIIKCSNSCAHYDWSNRVHYTSRMHCGVKMHTAYVTSVLRTLILGLLSPIQWKRKKKQWKKDAIHSINRFWTYSQQISSTDFRHEIILTQFHKRNKYLSLVYCWVR